MQGIDMNKFAPTVKKLMPIYKTQMEMIQDRGYNLFPDEINLLKHTNIVQFTIELATNYTNKRQESQSLRSFLSRLYNNNANAYCYVHYADRDANDKQLSIRAIENLENTIKHYSERQVIIKDVILISEIILSSNSNDKLKSLTDNYGLNITSYLDDDLRYNPTRHVDTQQHLLMAPQQARALMDKMNVNIAQLPIIQRGDVIAKYYGYTVKSLIKINRFDTAVTIPVQESVNYRVVV